MFCFQISDLIKDFFKVYSTRVFRFLKDLFSRFFFVTSGIASLRNAMAIIKSFVEFKKDLKLIPIQSYLNYVNLKTRKK